MQIRIAPPPKRNSPSFASTSLQGPNLPLTHHTALTISIPPPYLFHSISSPSPLPYPQTIAKQVNISNVSLPIPLKLSFVSSTAHNVRVPTNSLISLLSNTNSPSLLLWPDFCAYFAIGLLLLVIMGSVAFASSAWEEVSVTLNSVLCS